MERRLEIDKEKTLSSNKLTKGNKCTNISNGEEPNE